MEIIFFNGDSWGYCNFNLLDGCAYYSKVDDRAHKYKVDDRAHKYKVDGFTHCLYYTIGQRSN